jgi:hypothetical protein
VVGAVAREFCGWRQGLVDVLGVGDGGWPWYVRLD